MASDLLNKLEGRWVAFITAIALFFAGWWIQTEHAAVLKTQAQLEEYTRYVDDKYVQKDYLEAVDKRLDRIENKIDELKAAETKNNR